MGPVSCATFDFCQYSPIKALLEKFRAVKSANFLEATSKITSLASFFSGFSLAPPIDSGRIQFLGRHLLASLEENKAGPPSTQVIGILCEMANLKNALQVEAVFFGSVAPALGFYHQVSQTPDLKELWETLPEIFDNIKVTQENPGVYRLDIRPFGDFFDKADIALLPESFDTTMFQLVSGYVIEGHELLIPMGELPPRPFLQEFMSSTDPHSKLLAQMLYFLHFEDYLSLQASFPRILCSSLIEILAKKDLHRYLEKKDFIPHFSHLMTTVETYSDRGQPAHLALMDKSLLSRYSPETGSMWLVESAEILRLLLKIELLCKRIFSPGQLSDVLEQIELKGSDPFIKSWAKNLSRKDSFREDFEIPFPISDSKSFCASAEEFLLLPMHNYFLTNYDLAQKKAAKEKALAEKAKAKEFMAHLSLVKKADRLALCEAKEAELKAERHAKATESHLKKLAALESVVSKKGGSGACGGAGSNSSASSNAVSSASLMGVVSSHSGAKAICVAEVKSSSLAEDLKSSLVKSKAFISSVFFHQRVKSWQKSAEAGLAYYHFDDPEAGHVLSEPEMVLRHRLPKQLFLFAFNELYSKAQIWTNEDGQENTTWQSCVSIDGQKFVLEATIDSKQILYHYYAKPLRRWFDYFGFSQKKYPSLSKTSEAKDEELLASIQTEGVIFDTMRNALISFEGRTYKVLLLKP
jgi:hypothetical protein